MMIAHLSAILIADIPQGSLETSLDHVLHLADGTLDALLQRHPVLPVAVVVHPDLGRDSLHLKILMKNLMKNPSKNYIKKNHE